MRFRRWAPLVVVALTIAGCIGTGEPTGRPPTPRPTASSDLATLSPSLEPTDGPSEGTTPPPETTPSPPEESASPSASTGPGPADECSGTPANRSFFASVASAVDWTVYCADLPAGWFVDSGEYRLAGGGRMEIAYRGPGGARLELHEGAFCGDASGCVPAGTEIGDAAFSDKTGILVSADDGTWALAVDSGEAISWLAVGSALGEDAFRTITAGLIAVID